MIKNNVTKTEVVRSRIGGKTGWHFAVYCDHRKHAGFISSLTKTKQEAKKGLEHYLKTGEFIWWGYGEIRRLKWR